MKIAILDADLIARKRYRFPNLVCMKLSGYHKSEGDEITLKTDYMDSKSKACVNLFKQMVQEARQKDTSTIS